MIYFDSAATTLVKPRKVRENVLWAMKNAASTGRGQYRAAEIAENIVYGCREKAAKLFNVNEPDNVVFTFNATHGLNIAIHTLAFKGCKVVVSGYEHNAVMRPLRHVGADISVAKSPLFDTAAAISAFEAAVKPSTDFVVCTAMSNVFGFILPIYEIAEICKTSGVPLIIDASQGAGVMNLDFTNLGAAFMGMPGHKGLYGPQGTGLLLCSRNINPLISGGTGGNSALLTMPEFLPDAGEAGTHNVSGIAGLSAGIDFVMKTTPERIMQHEQKLLRRCVNKLNRLDAFNVYSSDDFSDQGGVLSLEIAGQDVKAFADYLSRCGVCVRYGLHCAPLAHKTAGTIENGTVRLSFSAFSTAEEVDEFIKIAGKYISR